MKHHAVLRVQKFALKMYEQRNPLDLPEMGEAYRHLLFETGAELQYVVCSTFLCILCTKYIKLTLTGRPPKSLPKKSSSHARAHTHTHTKLPHNTELWSCTTFT